MNYLSNCLMARYMGINYDNGMWGFWKLKVYNLKWWEAKEYETRVKHDTFNSLLKIIEYKMEVTEIINNSLRLKIIQKIIFKDLLLALLPYMSTGEIVSDNGKSMEQLFSSKKYGPCQWSDTYKDVELIIALKQVKSKKLEFSSAIEKKIDKYLVKNFS
jgi:hypothetical protein